MANSSENAESIQESEASKDIEAQQRLVKKTAAKKRSAAKTRKSTTAKAKKKTVKKSSTKAAAKKRTAKSAAKVSTKGPKVHEVPSTPPQEIAPSLTRVKGVEVEVKRMHENSVESPSGSDTTNNAAGQQEESTFEQVGPIVRDDDEYLLGLSPRHVPTRATEVRHIDVTDGAPDDSDQTVHARRSWFRRRKKSPKQSPPAVEAVPADDQARQLSQDEQIFDIERVTVQKKSRFRRVALPALAVLVIAPALVGGLWFGSQEMSRRTTVLYVDQDRPDQGSKLEVLSASFVDDELAVEVGHTMCDPSRVRLYVSQKGDSDSVRNVYVYHGEDEKQCDTAQPVTVRQDMGKVLEQHGSNIVNFRVLGYNNAGRTSIWRAN